MKKQNDNNGTKPAGPVFYDKNLQIIFLITLMAVLGVASITPAFPQIASEFGKSKQSVGLLIIFFTLPAIVLTPLLGVMADRFGRKNVLVPSLLLFGIAGGLCALVRKFEILLILRFFQGAGAASLGSINITLIGDIFSNSRRTEAMGYNASVLSIATASYPALGGLLASAGWYLPFILPIAAIPVAFVVLFRLNNPEPHTNQDLKQYFMSALAVIKTRRVIIYFTASFVTFIIIYGSYLSYFPFFLKKLYDASHLQMQQSPHHRLLPILIGLMMSCLSVATAVTASQLGRLSKLIEIKNLLKISFFMYAIALAMIPLVHGIGLLVIPLVIAGLAHGTNMPCVQILLTGVSPIENRAAFMSINGMVLRMGQTLGPLLMGTIYAMGGLGCVFFAGAVLAAGIFILLLAGLR
jgi:ACDE family multidrug resistance protein